MRYSAISSTQRAGFLCFFGGICLHAETVEMRPPQSDGNPIVLTCTISSDTDMAVDPETIRVSAASPFIEVISYKKLGTATALVAAQMNKRSFILQMTIKQIQHTMSGTPHLVISWFMHGPSGTKKPCVRYIAW